MLCFLFFKFEKTYKSLKKGLLHLNNSGYPMIRKQAMQKIVIAETHATFSFRVWELLDWDFSWSWGPGAWLYRAGGADQLARY